MRAGNRGARDAHGEYLVFLDADDLWFPWTLAHIATAIRRYPDTSFISGTAIRGPVFRSSKIEFPSAPFITRYENYFATAAAHLWIGVGGVAIRRTRFLHVGGFVEWQGNAEDRHLWLSLGTGTHLPEYRHSPPLFFVSLAGF